jgi:hypothetical protein
MSVLTPYEEPSMEVIIVTLERGFEASYGDYGEAGDEFDINNNGDF